MAAKTSKNLKKPKPGQVFGADGVFYSFPQGEGGPIQIKVDFALVPEPLNYYYADSLLLVLDRELRMAVLSFGRRDPKTNTFADRIEVVMPTKSLLDLFWASSREVETTLDKILKAIGETPKIRPVSLPESPAATLFANAIFIAAAEDESTLDFYHLSPRQVHLAKAQKKDMQIQPTIRVIMSSILTKHFFDTLKPHVGRGVAIQQTLEGGRSAGRTQ